MTDSMLRILASALCLASAILPIAQAAQASDTPLIWTPSQLSDSSYAMRMGSHLPTELEASAGTEISFTDFQCDFAPARTAHPVKFWSSVRVPSQRKDGGDAQIEVRLNGLTGRRSVWLSKSRSLDLTPDLAAQIEDLYSLDYDRTASDHRVDARASKTIRVLSKTKGTSLFARGTRSSRDQEWQASVGVEHKVIQGVNLSANIDNLAAQRPSGTLRASYAQRW
ncbi:hypothetical protein M2281_004228 [Mesorhizobium soli]|uniref:hypothetical protein n=1 Tax=Pseudaminobacter soli (ex Li et al. 2025) TaxID=1295366 RepID=UPI0024745BBD|nr:hypothetical protein [Mesorhizobium soli]MDH6233617.1 hypothetical protein [Mesorhizobium soli]